MIPMPRMHSTIPRRGRWASTGVRDRPHPVPCREASDTASPTESATPEQIVNKDTQIRVINATNVTGYAQSKANELTNAGYTSVTPSNPTGTVPTQTVVWYQNETDKATAEDVAQTLGITNVEQSDGLVTPIVVVLLN